MNAFLKKYGWLPAIVIAAAITAFIYQINQNSEPLVEEVVESTPAPVEKSEVVSTTIEVTPEVEDPEPMHVPKTEVAPEPEPEVTVEEMVADEPIIEEPIVDEVVAEAPIAEETTVEDPVTELVLEAPVEVTEPTPEAPVEQEVTVTPTPEPTSAVEETPEAPVAEAIAEITAVTEPSTEEKTTDESATEEASESISPSFDVVRVDQSGSAIIAGSAEPYSKVTILSNGKAIGEAIAGGSGEFVAIIQIPEDDQGQTLELESKISGTLLFSNESILILPILKSAAAEGVADESAPPIIKTTEDEITIIQGGSQLALGHVSLDTISYDENDEVVLAGRGNPGRTVIIYVDDAPLMDTVVSESGSWKQALHGLDAGRYVLRVDEIDADGTVTSRVESPFRREYPEDVREAKARSNATYTVQPGNSLWIIATGRYGDGLRYHQIFAANKDQIRDPDLIYPGQVFALPEPKG